MSCDLTNRLPLKADGKPRGNILTYNSQAWIIARRDPDFDSDLSIQQVYLQPFKSMHLGKGSKWLTSKSAGSPTHPPFSLIFPQKMREGMSEIKNNSASVLENVGEKFAKQTTADNKVFSS